MKTDLFSISKIFTEKLLRIPDFQRGYAWTNKQLKDYWNDLIQLEDNKNHYIGVLTLEEVPQNILNKWDEDEWIINAKHYEPFYVVDGQQRLTTTIILIQAITEIIPKDSKLNYTSIKEIKRKFLFDSKDEGISRSYIFGYEKDNPSYEYLKTNIFLETSENSNQIQETIYTHNLEAAKTFFKEKLNSLTIEEIGNIYTKITQRFLFNIYAISDDIDVFVAFETMNNRGKPLSHLELLKNRLIYLTTKFEVEPYEKNTLRRIINESWKSIYHYLGKNASKPLDDDMFLENHFLLYFGQDLFEKNDFKYDFEYDFQHNFYSMSRCLKRDYEYKDYLLEVIFTPKNNNTTENRTIKDIKNYAQSLQDSVEHWYKIFNPQYSSLPDEEIKLLEKINRLGIRDVAPLLMIFFQQEKNSQKRINFLSLIEQILFYNSFCTWSYRYNYEMRSLFQNLAFKLKTKDTKPKDVIDSLIIKLEQIKKENSLFKYFKGELSKRNGFYAWSGIKYFLYEYEQDLKTISKTYSDKIVWDTFIEDSRDYITVEHIYPQTTRKVCWIKPFEKYTSNQRKILKHSLGNLLPLSKPKNSSLQNKPFEEKKGNENIKIGYRYGSYSENEVACYDEWNAHTILKRGLKLLDFMEKRWDIHIGDRNEKIKFLNLSFVEKKEFIVK